MSNKNRMRKNTSFKINILAFTACFLWSTGFAGVKIGLNYMPPLLFAGIRFMLAGLMLLPFCGNLKDYFKNVTKNLKQIILLGFFQTFCLYSLFFVGMTYISGALGAIVVGSSPLIAAVTSHLLLKDDKLNLKKLFFIIFGISGIVLISITRQPLSISGTNEIFGIILLLCAIASSAIGNVIVSKNKTQLKSFVLTSSQMFSGGLMIFILSIPIEKFEITNLQFEFFAMLLWLCLVSAAGFAIWFYLLQIKSVKVSELNIWKFMLPVLGAVISWMIIPDERPELFIIIGMIIVGSSILLFNIISRKEK